MIRTVENEIADTNCDEIRSIFATAPYPAYDYQCAAYRLTSEAIRASQFEPSVIVASVSAGKTDMISMVAYRIQEMNKKQYELGREPYQCMILSRQAEIIDQDAAQMWKYGVQNSIFCAGLSRKSAAFPIVAASEGTAVNGLFDSMREKHRLKITAARRGICVRSPASAKAMFEYIRKHTKRGELRDFAPFFVLIDECLTGDSMISTNKGEMRMDDPALVDAEIKCIDERSGNIFYHKPKRVFSNGIKHVSSLKLKSGVEIKCTGNHQLLSNGSWVAAGSLKEGDCLTLSAHQDSFMTKLSRAVVAVGKRLFQKAHS